MTGRTRRSTDRRRLRLAPAGARSWSRSATCSTAGCRSDRSISDVRRALIAPGLLREFNDIGVLAAADVHVAVAAGRARGRDRRGGRARRPRSPSARPRLGHVYVDLATIRETAAVDSDEPVDLTALPWPELDGLESRAWPRARSSRWGRTAAESRPLRLVGSGALPRPLLARGTPGRRRPARAAAARSRSTSRASPTASTACSRRAEATARAAAARPRQAAVRRRFAVVAGGPGTGKTTTVARIVALLAEQAAAAGDPRRWSRSPRRPARPRRGCRRRCTRRRARSPCADIRDELLALERVDAAPAARLAARQPQPLPAQPRQPAAARRRDRRRDVDGVAVADGAAGRGGAAARRGSCSSAIPGQLTSIEAGAVLGDIVRRRRRRASSCSSTCTATARGSTRSRTRSAPATATR